MALTLPSLDLSAFTQQFRGLRGRAPALWPVAPRLLLLAGVFAAVLSLGWLLYWGGLLEELDAGQAQERQLREEYADKLRRAVNLEALRRQKEQVGQYVNTLEKQLPSRAEMDALLSDINQAGTGRGLQFELFKPGQAVVREYYAELPIAVRVVGLYHDIGAFASDISNLARIVTLNNLSITLVDKAAPGQPAGSLAMDATAKTFRYLDPDEVTEQRRRAAAEKKVGGRP